MLELPNLLCKQRGSVIHRAHLWVQPYTANDRHTGGAVMLPAYANDDFIKANFADLEFFKASCCFF